MMITIIGRGHSGTRAMSHTLSASGVYMGEPLNRSGDLLPPEQMYEACRVLARHVRWRGGLEWDWSALHEVDIPDEFIDLIQGYLRAVLDSPAGHRGWKIPETTLVFPWIVRLFPDIKYIYWIRNPRDCIIGRHKTDDLRDFGIEYPDPPDLLPASQDERPPVADPPSADDASVDESSTGDEQLLAREVRLRRAISWKYQYDLVKATPKPGHWLEVRFEDFCLRQDETLARLEAYLGLKLVKVPVQVEAVGRWKQDEGINYYDFLAPAMIEYGYEMPVARQWEDRRPECFEYV
jgi:hypothetical protein